MAREKPRRSPLERLRRAVRLHRLRILRQRSTPSRIARGVAIGFFCGSIPILPSQMITATLLALLLRASAPAAVIATLHSNPLTFTPLYALYFSIGRLLFPHVRVDIHPSVLDWNQIFEWRQVFGEGRDALFLLTAGGAVTGGAAAAVAYFVTRRAVAAYQRRRREKARRGDEAGERRE